MERSVSVNAGSGSDLESALADGSERQSVNIHGQRALQPDFDSGAEFMANPTLARPRVSYADQGPCLYLGPAGQRCTQRAIEGGFCARHQHGAPAIIGPFLTPKKIAALFVALAMLWPELARIISALVRLFR
ncbi:MAG: hypothetical protein WB987_15310 [Candidatus Acidiferrales bacterium]